MQTAKLDMNKLRGKAYDNAGNMVGQCNGAAKLLLYKYPKALYCWKKQHC